MKIRKKILSLILCVLFVGTIFAGCGPVEPTLTGIEVITKPAKTEYNVGDTLNLTGGELTLKYSDDSTSAISLSDSSITVTAPSMSTTGTKNVTVAYGGFTTTFPITITYAQCTVTFNLNYSGAPAPQVEEVLMGDSISAPATPPVRDGYRFDGWYTASTGGSLCNFADSSIMSDTVIYAHWTQIHTVSFNLNYTGSGVPDEKPIYNSETVAAPSPDPSRSGFRFDGWFTAASGGTAYNFGAPVTSSFSIYAHWSQEYAVTFKLNYIGAPTDMIVNVYSGDTVSAPLTSPEPRAGEQDGKAGNYLFKYWSTSQSGAEYVFTTPVMSDMNLYAVWEFSEVQIHEVTFYYNYTGAPAAGKIFVNNDQTATPPQTPTRPKADGVTYAFGGWYTEAACTNVYNFSLAVSAPVALYAKWNSTHFDVTLMYNYTGNTGVYQTVTVPAGTAMVAPANPAKWTLSGVGYKFKGWYLDAGGQTAYAAGAPVNAVRTLYADWDVDYYNVTYKYNDISISDKVLEIVPGTIISTLNRNGAAAGDFDDEQFDFDGWYSDSERTVLFVFGNTAISSALTIYGKITKAASKYTFEAEYVFVQDSTYQKAGVGSSNALMGYDMIFPDNKTAGASNGHFISGMYTKGITLDFIIVSDRAVTDAKLEARLSAEYFDPKRIASTNRTVGGLDYHSFVFDVVHLGATQYNGALHDPYRNLSLAMTYQPDQRLEYGEITLRSLSENPGQKDIYPFETYMISMTMNLCQGVNIVRLMTNNNVNLAGSGSADGVAPIIDCLYITTQAVLTWQPLTDNLTHVDPGKYD